MIDSKKDHKWGGQISQFSLSTTDKNIQMKKERVFLFVCFFNIPVNFFFHPEAPSHLKLRSGEATYDASVLDSHTIPAPCISTKIKSYCFFLSIHQMPSNLPSRSTAPFQCFVPEILWNRRYFCQDLCLWLNVSYHYVQLNPLNCSTCLST